MHAPLGSEQRRDLAARGFSRRDMVKFAALLAAGSSLPFYNESTLAQGLSALPNLSNDAVRINANENPMGPCPEAVEAITRRSSRRGGRYLYNETSNEFVQTLAEVEGLSPELILPVRRVERPAPPRCHGVHRPDQEPRHRRPGV